MLGSSTRRWSTRLGSAASAAAAATAPAGPRISRRATHAQLAYSNTPAQAVALQQRTDHQYQHQHARLCDEHEQLRRLQLLTTTAERPATAAQRVPAPSSSSRSKAQERQQDGIVDDLISFLATPVSKRLAHPPLEVASLCRLMLQGEYDSWRANERVQALARTLAQLADHTTLRRDTALVSTFAHALAKASAYLERDFETTVERETVVQLVKAAYALAGGFAVEQALEYCLKGIVLVLIRKDGALEMVREIERERLGDSRATRRSAPQHLAKQLDGPVGAERKGKQRADFFSRILWHLVDSRAPRHAYAIYAALPEESQRVAYLVPLVRSHEARVSQTAWDVLVEHASTGTTQLNVEHFRQRLMALREHRPRVPVGLVRRTVAHMHSLGISPDSTSWWNERLAYAARKGNNRFAGHREQVRNLLRKMLARRKGDKDVQPDAATINILASKMLRQDGQAYVGRVGLEKLERLVRGADASDHELVAAIAAVRLPAARSGDGRRDASVGLDPIYANVVASLLLSASRSAQRQRELVLSLAAALLGLRRHEKRGEMTMLHESGYTPPSWHAFQRHRKPAYRLLLRHLNPTADDALRAQLRASLARERERLERSAAGAPGSIEETVETREEH